MHHETGASIERIDQLLPQTQCTQCDFPRCRDYAEAIANGEAEINQCPPGGSIAINALSQMLQKPASPLNPANGIEEPRLLAIINEAACIGCKLCIKACPVDCILGAGKMMHTVIANECTGCKLCLPVCPTDCIDLIPPPPPDPNQAKSRFPAFSQPQVDKARRRTEQKLIRLSRREAERRAYRLEKKRSSLRREIQAVLARKRAGNGAPAGQ